MQRTERPTISSSSLRRTKIATRLASLEIGSAPSELRESSISMPRKPNPSQMRADDGRVFADTIGEDERVQSTECLPR